MAHVMENKMTANMRTTAEIVFHRPNFFHNLLPPVMLNVGRVAVVKFLGVYLKHHLHFLSLLLHDIMVETKEDIGNECIW